MDIRDWVIIGHLNAAGIAATTFVFMHPDPVIFGIYAGLMATLVNGYHWINVRDDKLPDAPNAR